MSISGAGEGLEKVTYTSHDLVLFCWIPLDCEYASTANMVLMR